MIFLFNLMINKYIIKKTSEHVLKFAKFRLLLTVYFTFTHSF